MAHQIDKTALVMHSSERMFHLVNDISRYPEFLPWCAGAEVHKQTDQEIMASLEIAKGGVRHTLTTCNQLLMPESIEMKLVEGPLKNLTGRWHFRSLDSNACKVILSLEFEFSGSLSRMTFGPVFNQAANTMVDAFCRRADEVYRAGGALLMRVEVAYARSDKQQILEVAVPEGTTALEAVKVSGIVDVFPEINPDEIDMGIFGKVVKKPASQVLNEGDRVELYRPLIIDPKQARLNRAKKKT